MPPNWKADATALSIGTNFLKNDYYLCVGSELAGVLIEFAENLQVDFFIFDFASSIALLSLFQVQAVFVKFRINLKFNQLF